MQKRARLILYTHPTEHPVRREVQGEVGQHAEDPDAQIGGRQVGEEEVGHGAHLPVSQHNEDHENIAWK